VVSEFELPVAPFPGMGIRLDVYELVTVTSVVVGDPGYDVTCIVEIEDVPAGEITADKCRSLGFEISPYP
jgi:hypothetical protein